MIKKLIVGGLALAIVFITLTFGSIYRSVKTNCQKAKAQYKKSCVDSLITQLTADNATFRERNTAIWTLGQLANKKALPTLQSLYTGNTSRRENLEITISQYELKKAIKWCTKGNLTSWMYRSL